MRQRKGFELGIGFVVTAVIVLAVAVVVMVVIGPRVLKTGELGERFFPEKCAISGKTLEEHSMKVVDLLGANDIKGALVAYSELKMCFPEHDLAPEWKIELIRPIGAEVARLSKTPTRASYQQIVRLYYESFSAITPAQQKDLFDTQTLLSFARALVVQGWRVKSLDESRSDARRLVGILAEKAASENNKMLEAETLSLAFLEGDIEVSRKKYEELVKRFGSEKGPEFNYFVGTAYRSLHKLDESVTALKEARSSSDPYILVSANYDLGMAYYELWLYKKDNKEYQVGIADAFERILKENDGLYSDAVLRAYSMIPDESRKLFNDCVVGQQPAGQCICQTFAGMEKVPLRQGNALLQEPRLLKPGDGFCCKGFVSSRTDAFPCYYLDCEQIRKIKDCYPYKEPQDCENDPCDLKGLIRPQAPAYRKQCEWFAGYSGAQYQEYCKNVQ